MRDSPPPHPAWLGSPRTKHASLSTASAPKTVNIRGVVVISPSRGPIFVNTQCEAVQRRIPLGLGPHAPSSHHPRWWERLNRESSRHCREIADSIAHTPLSSGLHAPDAHHSPRWACQNREYSRRRCQIAVSRAQFRIYAMRDSPPPHPARPGFPRTKHTPLYTANVSKEGEIEASS